MKKNTFGRQLKRDINERKALFKNLMTSLVMHDRIQTTEAKAKAIRASVEKLVTKAKKKGVNSTPELLPFLNQNAVNKMLNDIALRFADRPGGYTRIVKTGRRFGDDAKTVIMEWVESGKDNTADTKNKKSVKDTKKEVKTQVKNKIEKSKSKTNKVNKNTVKKPSLPRKEK